MDSIQMLINEIKMTNNGYIFVATPKQVEIAYANPDIFRTFGIGFNGLPKISMKQSGVGSIWK